MAGTGALLKTREVASYPLYRLMIGNWTHGAKNVNKLKKDIAKEAIDFPQHDLGDIQADLKHIQEDIDGVVHPLYKFVYREMLIFRKAVYTLRLAGHSAADILKVAESELKAILKGNPKMDHRVKRIIKHLLEQDTSIEESLEEHMHEIIAEAHEDLRKEHKAILSDLQIEDGKTGMALTFKGNGTNMARRMQVRWGPLLNIQLDQATEARVAKEIEKEKQRIERALKALPKNITQHHGRNKDLQIIGKAFKGLSKSIADLFDAAEDLVKSTYKAFIFAMMALEDVAEAIPNQKKIVMERDVKHDITKAMDADMVKAMEEDGRQLHAHLKSIRTFVLQLYGATAQNAKAVD